MRRDLEIRGMTLIEGELHRLFFFAIDPAARM
jgi:hypothetical protein